MAVYNSAGELVKEILVTRTNTGVDNLTGESDTLIDRVGDVVNLYWQGTWIGSWDGTNTDGKAVANGEYYVKVDSLDPMGVTRSVNLDVTVNRKVARLDITIYNAAGEAVRHLTSVEAADLGAAVAEVGLSTEVIEPGANTVGVASTLTISLPNGTTVVWDGRCDTGATVADGQYYVEVKTEGDGGSGTVVVKTVAVLGTPAGKTAMAWPNVLTAVNPVAVIKAGVPNRTVKAVVYTAAGEKSAVLWGLPGAGCVSWDSRGAADGYYLVVVDLFDGTGLFAGRSIVKIIVRK